MQTWKSLFLTLIGVLIGLLSVKAGKASPYAIATALAFIVLVGGMADQSLAFILRSLGYVINGPMATIINFALLALLPLMLIVLLGLASFGASAVTGLLEWIQWRWFIFSSSEAGSYALGVGLSLGILVRTFDIYQRFVHEEQNFQFVAALTCGIAVGMIGGQFTSIYGFIERLPTIHFPLSFFTF
jgi:hypothetical protein